MQQLIKANNITLNLDGKTVLNNVSLEVNKNDFITVIGPNGAGKSMLLKCLMGLFKINRGEINLKTGLKIGYVPQNIAQNYSMPISVEGFLRLRKKIDEKELVDIANEVGISDILQKQFYVLSGGEMQRVLLARALLAGPEILILDEPAQNLDISGQLSFYKLLENIYKKREIAILMVSHDLHFVMASSKQVICLFHHVCCAGEPHAIKKDPEFISMFGNDMARMMAIYNHSHDHEHEHIHDVSCKHKEAK